MDFLQPCQQIQQFNALQDQRFREAQAQLEMGRLGAEESIAGQLAGLQGAGMAAALGGLSSVGYGLEGTKAGRRMDEQVGGLFNRNQSTGGGFDYAPGASPTDEPLEDDIYFGRKGMKLPGKFNHGTNPIALMRNGRKIGEATGDEVVLNPEQINKISKQSSYLRKLLKQPRFQ